MNHPITVLKLGGSVLASEHALPRAIHEIYREVRDGRRVVAVVSAFRGVTDALARRARSILPQPTPEALATLLGTGETETTALLALALGRAGIPAAVLDPERLRLLAAGDPLDADPSPSTPARSQRHWPRCRWRSFPGSSRATSPSGGCCSAGAALI